jgi:peptidoglycan/LPS O-acetylase OafA/YrhL
MDKSISRYPTLDFLRGIAILGVLSFHVFILFDVNSSLVRAVMVQGVYGVQLFFFVSAFTMCLMWDYRSAESRRAVKFYIRRFFRIAPPFWLAIAAYLWLNGTAPSGWAPYGIGFHQIAATILFVHSFWPDAMNSVVPGGWSIGVEMIFYLFFPMVAGLKLSVRSCLTGAFATYIFNISVVRPLYEMLFLDYGPASLIEPFLYFQFFYQAPIFLLGIAVYKSTKNKEGLGGFLTLGAVWLTTAFALKYGMQVNSSPFFWLIVAMLCLIVATSLKLNLSFRPLNRLGELSYSIYLSHFAVIQGVQYIFQYEGIEQHSLPSLLVALATSLTLSWLVASALEVSLEALAASAGKKIVSAVPT